MTTLLCFFSFYISFYFSLLSSWIGDCFIDTAGAGFVVQQAALVSELQGKFDPRLGKRVCPWAAAARGGRMKWFSRI
jgi:hypothetical protein